MGRECFGVVRFDLGSLLQAVFTLKENMEVVRRTFNSENVKVRTKTNKSKVYLFTV